MTEHKLLQAISDRVEHYASITGHTDPFLNFGPAFRLLPEVLNDRKFDRKSREPGIEPASATNPEL